MIAAEIRIDRITDEEYQEREAWCTQNFGSRALFRDHVDNDNPWFSLYSPYMLRWWWYFARKEDATLFALRWL